MKKQYLQSIIQKYNLGGAIETVTWKTTNKKLSIKFVSDDKSLTGEIKSNKFGLPDSEISIFSTSKLLKIIGIVDHEIALSLNKKNNVYDKLIIDDKNYNLQFTLAEPMLVNKPPTVADIEYDLEATITEKDIGLINKARGALSKENNYMLLKSYEDEFGRIKIKFIFGEKSDYADKINFSIDAKGEENIVLPFNSDLFRDILYNNKELGDGTIKISKKGLMEISFKNKDISTLYYLLRLSN